MGRSGGSIDQTVRRLKEDGALRKAGFGPCRGSRKKGAQLYTLNPDWEPDLAVALAHGESGRIGFGTELLMVPFAALAFVREHLAGQSDGFAWTARLPDSTFGLVLASHAGDNGGAVDRLLVELADQGARCVRVVCGEPRPVSQWLADGATRRKLPSAGATTATDD